MKIKFLALPLLCVAGVAMADGVDREAESAQTVAAQERVQDREQMHARKTTRLPQGDLRHCLDLQTNDAIIRCSETRRKR
ncbi:hypothetical protein [Thiobacillus denitrificans]|uniref:Uncharacterized protein n=1 Tax=Thiobacillus denitrificans TaxID=36861 RepID=A0A119CVD1_THIDE|nr:hypothetical protein [Thiobacillus denitrificans]KVW94979.1 hypothetical protein ABW22_11105 [Thiobacillus denitrificans]